MYTRLPFIIIIVDIIIMGQLVKLWGNLLTKVHVKEPIKGHTKSNFKSAQIKTQLVIVV